MSYLFYIVLFFYLSFINSLTFNETFYKYLKENAEFKVVDIDINQVSKYRRMGRADDFDFKGILNTISDIISFIEIIYNFATGNYLDGLVDLVESSVSLGIFESLPDEYNLIKEKSSGYRLYLQDYDESSAGYIVEYILSYRRFISSGKDLRSLSPYTIYEYYYRNISAFSIIDAFEFAHNYGLLPDWCRHDTLHSCTFDSCEICEFYSSSCTCDNDNQIEPFKGGEPYKIEGKENIQKEIYKNGPVAVIFPLYENMIYYNSGVIEKGEGKKIGYYNAVIYGWDSEGWLVLSSFPLVWGNRGFFRVSFDNKFDFGTVAIAKSSNNKNSIIFLIFILCFIF